MFPGMTKSFCNRHRQAQNTTTNQTVDWSGAHFQLMHIKDWFCTKAQGPL